MVIQEAIVHRLDKVRQQPSKAVFRNACLPIDALLTESVEKARKAYGTTSSKAFGVFEPDAVVYPLSDQLLKYITGTQSMIAFSVAAMKLLQKELDAEPLATGAYVLFVSYEEAGKRFVMIVLLKLRGEVGIDDVKLELNANWNLDVEHLHEAARVHVDNWQAKTGNYISFAKRSRDYTGYFRDFIGCAEYVESKQQTTLLIQAIREYCVESNLSSDEAQKLKAKAYDYFEEQFRDKKTVSLTALSMRFNDQDPKAFSEYIVKKDYEISDNFDPHKATYKHLRRLGGKDADLTINFDRGLLGKRVKYDKKNKTLLITDLPPALITELDNEV